MRTYWIAETKKGCFETDYGQDKVSLVKRIANHYSSNHDEITGLIEMNEEGEIVNSEFDLVDFNQEIADQILANQESSDEWESYAKERSYDNYL